MKFSEFLKSNLSHQPHYLLIGNPISHSLSPLMHNTAFQYYGLQARYQAVAVSINDIDSLVAHFNSNYFLGANITIPHKKMLVDTVDELSSAAKKIGVINTIVKKNGKLTGHNTDAYGFRTPLEEIGEDITLDRAIIFGVGGATKAILHALGKMGFEEICLVSREPEHHRFKNTNHIVCSYDSWPHYCDEATLLVNATPLGMAPHIDSSPIKDQEIELLEKKVCYDIVYNPRETKFIKQAKLAGGYPIGGIDMLIHQGAKAFELWTGKPFPISLVKMKLDAI
jgi:shikimate dehydrogenase